MKIGLDLIEISRFDDIKKNDFNKWSKVYTRQEWLYAFKQGKSAERLAGMFVAKEAAMKAVGKVGSNYFKKWEIHHRLSGKPALIPRGFLSISHNNNIAIAIVIIP